MGAVDHCPGCHWQDSFLDPNCKLLVGSHPSCQQLVHKPAGGRCQFSHTHMFPEHLLGVGRDWRSGGTNLDSRTSRTAPRCVERPSSVATVLAARQDCNLPQVTGKLMV